jgi:type II secretory pathway component GspD/PulD (secretin)
MLPVLRPLIGSDAALSGIDYKLFVRGTATDVARIREALTVLDRAPRQLMVSVRYNDNPQDRSTGVSVGGSVGNGAIGNRNKVTVHAGTTLSTASDSRVSSVRVLEGNGAHIATGQTVPLVTAVRWPTRSNQNQQNTINGVAIDYHEFSSGFEVMPRINGDRVLLEVSTQQERAPDGSRNGGAVQRANTTVAGRLGEWIELGGVTTSSYQQNSNVGTAGGGRTTTQSDRQAIEVKVDEVE